MSWVWWPEAAPLCRWPITSYGRFLPKHPLCSEPAAFQASGFRTALPSCQVAGRVMRRVRGRSEVRDPGERRQILLQDRAEAGGTFVRYIPWRDIPRVMAADGGVDGARTGYTTTLGTFPRMDFSARSTRSLP